MSCPDWIIFCLCDFDCTRYDSRAEQDAAIAMARDSAETEGLRPLRAAKRGPKGIAPMIHQFKRDFFIWWGCRKLNKLVARSRAKSEQYTKRRKAALRHTPKEWA